MQTTVCKPLQPEHVPRHASIPAVLPGTTAAVRVPLTHAPGLQAPEQGTALQVAVKCNQLGVLYFADNISQQAAAPAAAAAADPLAGLL